ncbi:MAG TPA: Uma2 family endonuclease [Chloroflexota bacterium]|jgi:Uma2 family endonuclease
MVTTRLTLEEFLRLPEQKPALEYADGVVTQKVAPQGRHGALQWSLTTYFNNFGVPQVIAYAIPELRTTYAGVSRVPDVAVYLWDRIPWTPDGEVPDDFTAAPDVAIEIVSPDQSRPELTRKCEWYVTNGVAIALLVDPDHRSVDEFRPGQPPAAWRGADAIDFAPVLPGLRLVVDDIFSWLRPGRAPRGNP